MSDSRLGAISEEVAATVDHLMALVLDGNAAYEDLRAAILAFGKASFKDGYDYGIDKGIDILDQKFREVVEDLKS